MKPKYAEKVVSYVVYKGRKSWHIVDKEVWYLDLRKLIKAYEDKGYMVPNSDDFSDRFNIDIVTDENMGDFYEALGEFEISSKSLKDELASCETNEKWDYLPSIYVDFDQKLFISYFPEPGGFENYVPSDWAGRYEDFLQRVDIVDRYWMSGEVDLFREGTV